VYQNPRELFSIITVNHFNFFSLVFRRITGWNNAVYRLRTPYWLASRSTRKLSSSLRSRYPLPSCIASHRKNTHHWGNWWCETGIQKKNEHLVWIVLWHNIYRVFQKTDTQFYFWDNLGNSAPILTILSLLQAEIYGA